MKNKEKNTETTLSGFVNFINAKNGINLKDSGSDGSSSQNNGQLLLEISSHALPVMSMPQISCCLKGNILTVRNKSKQLTNDQMDYLYRFILYKYQNQEFEGLLNLPYDYMDGTTHTYFIKWNGIMVNGETNDLSPKVLEDIVNSCENLLN